jgi:hypothetical protein
MPGAGGSGAGAGGTPGAGGQPATFEAWLAGQDKTVKGLVSQHIAGLRNALEMELLRQALEEARK